MLPPPARETVRTELMDGPDARPDELAASLADLARLNRLGGTRAILAHVAPLVEAHRGPGPVRVLDVGTGAADVPLALVRWARRRRRAVRVIALEVHPVTLRYAARAAAGAPEVHVVGGDALAAPIRAGGVDVALCSLVLHHLAEEAVVRALRALAGLAGTGVVVSDLRRGWGAWAGVWLATRVLSRNRLTRHDGPLSVRRAYTPGELERLAARAGLAGMRWHRALPFRLVGVWRRPARGGAGAG